MTNGLSVNDITPLGERPADVWRGRTGISLAGVGTIEGSPISRPPNDGELLVYDAATDSYLQVNEFDLVNSGYLRSGVLAPTAAITATKSASNPTFAFDALPENILKVGATYWAVYMDNVGSAGTLNLASATDRNGPWTAYASNPLYTIASVSWKAASTRIDTAYLLEDSGTYYLFYAVVKTSGATDSGNGIGYATASTVTGPYTDHGSAILSPGAGTTWDSRRVTEMAVRRESNRWIMAYMGESSAASYQASEKVGVATATTPGGTWTKAAANPVIDFGSGWDAGLVADPDLFFANGYYWIMYAGATTGPAVTAQQGLAYSLDPTTTFTRYSGNPFLGNGGGGSIDSVWSFRGCIWIEDGLYSGIYTGYDGSLFRGGNFALTVTPATPGTVSSVGLTVPAEFSVSGSPVTGSGTLAVTKATEAANTVWAGPTSGAAAQPTFRALVAADIPAGSGGSAAPAIPVWNVTLNGDGATTVFYLPAAPYDAYSIAVYVGTGRNTDWTLSGAMLDVLTFGTAPVSGTNNISIDIMAST